MSSSPLIHTLYRFIAAVVMVSCMLQSAIASEDDGLLVFAAASLTNAVDSVITEFKKSHDQEIKTSYASSSVLAKQIEAGAGADIFISADDQWIDFLQEKTLIKNDTRTALLGNKLILIAPESRSVSLKIEKGFALAMELGDHKLAMGDPDHVPAGIYGKEALTSLGVWDAVKDKVAAADNVRAALTLVALGETPLGIVYKTDALEESKVTVVDTFPKDSHSPIVYSSAVTAQSKNPLAEEFSQFLSSKVASDIFSKYGFTPLTQH